MSEQEEGGFAPRDRRRDTNLRKGRDADLRSENVRVMEWTPPSSLPDPPPDDDWCYRWCRASVLAVADNSNMSTRIREGWVPVTPAEQPELAAKLSFKNESNGDMIEVGGLVLCKMPRPMAEARSRYYENLARRQMGSVEERLRELDGGALKVSINRKTRISSSPFE